MIKQLSYLVVLIILMVSCKTNPPTSPDITPTGNVTLNLMVDNGLNVLDANKIVLIEDFANVSCIPCVASNKVIEAVSHSYGPTKLAVIKFPTNFPSPYDPFYLANEEICDERMNYYNIIAAPTTILDGTTRLYSLTDTTTLKSAIDTKLSSSPRFGINVTKNFEGDYIINASISMIDTNGINLNDLIIYCVVTETDIEFEQAPGSNGETKFFDVIRLMLPSTAGTSVRQLIDQGDLSFQFNDALLSSWNLENINAVVFIQDKNSKEVFQSGSPIE
jgi:hypothetical protein